MELLLNAGDAGLPGASPWVQRFTSLLPPGGQVLDVACGGGRHMRWFAERGHRCTGIDIAAPAVALASAWGDVVQADIENGPWPLMQGTRARQFDAVIVTNYLWRPLFATLLASLAPGGVLIYETFSQGNERHGRPSRADFLLQPGELLWRCATLSVVAYENGWIDQPPRVVQRIAAVRPPVGAASLAKMPHYPI